MKKLSTLSKSAIVVVGALGIGTIAIASGQIPAISGAKISDAVAIAKSKISLEQAIAIAQKTVKGDLISAELIKTIIWQVASMKSNLSPMAWSMK